VAAPSVLFVESTIQQSFVNDHTPNLPTIRQPGEHLVMFFSMGGDGGVVTDPPGWQLIHFSQLFNDDNGQWHIWIREVDGTEADEVTIETTGANKSVTHIVRLSGARQGVVEGTTWDFEFSTTSYGTKPNPPSATASWGAADNLVIAAATFGNSGATVVTYPTGFVNTTAFTAGPSCAIATKALSATATDDPSEYTISASNTVRGGTLIIRDAATVIAGAEAATATAQASDATVDPPTTVAVAEAATATATAFWATTPEIPVASDVTIEWDFDGDGDFSEAVEDITDYVLGGSCRRGRDFASQVTGRSTPGEMSILLRNDDNRFNHFNTDSPLNTAPNSLKGGRLIRVRTCDLPGADPSELARASFNGSGPLATADTGETWTTETTAGFSEFRSEAQADGPPSPAAAGGGEEDPGAYTWTPLDHSTVVTAALRPADGETISQRDQSELTYTAAGTSHNITAPATIEADDLLFLVCATQTSSTEGPPATPSGWTQRFTTVQDSGFRPEITCFYKIAVGNEDSTSILLDWGASSVRTHAVMVAFDGVDTTTPFDVTEATEVEGTSNPDPAAITPVTGGAWVLTIAAANDDVGSTPAVTIPSGYTSVFDQTTDERAFVIARLATAVPSTGTNHIETIDCGEDDYYAQVVIPRKDTTNEVGLVYNWTDIDNYGLVFLSDGLITIAETVAGVYAVKTSQGAENRDQVALGVEVVGTAITAYLDGVNEIGATSTLTATSEVGIYGKWFSQRPPAFTELRIWDKTRVGFLCTGIVATMHVSKIEPFMDRSGRQLASLTARGELRALERPISPPESTGPDDLQSAGVRAGHMIGNTLHKAGLLHPPAKIDDGYITLGSVGFDRQRAMNLVRAFEETDGGFVYETRDGSVAFDQRDARDGSAVVATFTDDPLVPGFAFEVPRQRSWEGDVINRVRSEISPSLPRQLHDTDFNVTSLAATNDVAITIPAAGTGDSEPAAGDLMIVVVASTVNADGVFWLNPPGWTNLRPLTDELGTRVYAKKLTASDFGDTVTFYDDSTPAGGGWAAVYFFAKNWYGVIDSGVALTEFAGHGNGSAQALAGDSDPPVMFTPWATGPTLFLAIRAGIGGSSGGATQQSASDDIAPPGFDSLGSHWIDGVANAQDAGLQWARRIRTESIVNPQHFGGEFTGYNLVETAVIAVRGFAGDPPPSSGGLAVISDNTQSQLDREAVLSHPHPGRLFEDEVAALEYNDFVLTRFDQDRPIFEVSFTATRDAKVRDMVLARDLSDRVRIDADGASGFGFDAEFFIEAIGYSWQEGGTMLEATFHCSPATDGGGGAD